MAGSYNWNRDNSILALRDVLGLRRKIRKSFREAITAVSQALIYYCQFTPSPVGEYRVLFTIPDEIFVSTIAERCNISRYTVYRVLDYLAAIGDCETTTRFNPVTNEYLPTSIVLKTSLFTRIGFSYEELGKAVRALTGYSKERERVQQQARQFIAKRIAQVLRPASKRRLGAETEKLLLPPAIEDENKAPADLSLLQNPNFVTEEMLNKFRSPTVTKDDYTSNDNLPVKPVIPVDPRFQELRKSGLTIREAREQLIKLIKSKQD
ncbi:hypothetical protein [Shewanella marisflavi]|uniref:hypothetical protein n=1 Tax=Shewanella marisflavi TaxID=260364 RepID=UPI003AAC0D01